MNWLISNKDCVSSMRGAEMHRTASLVFADPPYNIGIEYGDHFNDAKSDSDYLDWCRDWIGGIFGALTDDGSFWLLCNYEYVSELDTIARKACGFHRHQWLTWYESFGVNCKSKFNRTSRPLLWYVKDPKRFTCNYMAPEVRRLSDRAVKYNDKRANPNGKLWDDVWGINPTIPRVCGTFKERIEGFPTQLPVSLLTPIVAISSNPEDLVLDPFSGSATTGEAALRLGRKYHGFELSRKFSELSCNRLSAVGMEVEAKIRSCVV